jgi:hypothetical protein
MSLTGVTDGGGSVLQHLEAGAETRAPGTSLDRSGGDAGSQGAKPIGNAQGELHCGAVCVQWG